MFYQPQRTPDQAFDFGGLGDKIPQDMGGVKPTIPLNPQQTGQDLTQEQKLAAAEAEIARRQQQTTPLLHLLLHLLLNLKKQTNKFKLS